MQILHRILHSLVRMLDSVSGDFEEASVQFHADEVTTVLQACHSGTSGAHCVVKNDVSLFCECPYQPFA